MSEPKKTKEQAIRDLRAVISHLRLAIRTAKEKCGQDGLVAVSIVAMRLDGTGEVTCAMRAPEFAEDIALALGLPADTEDEEAEARAIQFLDRVTT